ncbi:phytanoyl-CoA dioxygenase family protein [Loktanella sp. Alg231-35]|uniref:phytanoyl-CoA dioxygenase family protein n=1 Tax=Loktanella sp. Alg231-35 TaxID=1922220 RepID=UPI000D55E9E4|nr:phytanoyl-CoA dioxygenase family protein [Loktanella sp. Alg231-35]
MDKTSAFDGMMWLRGALSEQHLAALDTLGTMQAKPGLRIGLSTLVLDALRPVDQRIQKVLPKMEPVRLVAFDKTSQSNWALPWHQDRVIEVKENHDVDGYDNWDQKDGIWHCEPPVSLLKQMLFVRVHLDDTDGDGGAMEVAIGSHQEGKIDAGQAKPYAERYQTHVCQARRGDVLVMDMLTLHRSLPARKPSSRRVLRVDYAAIDLPYPLAWAK